MRMLHNGPWLCIMLNSFHILAVIWLLWRKMLEWWAFIDSATINCLRIEIWCQLSLPINKNNKAFLLHNKLPSHWSSYPLGPTKAALVDVHSTSAPELKTVYNWVSEFKRSLTSTSDEQRSVLSLEVLRQRWTISSIWCWVIEEFRERVGSFVFNFTWKMVSQNIGTSGIAIAHGGE